MNASRSKGSLMLIAMVSLALITIAVASPVRQVLERGYQSISNHLYCRDYRFLFEHVIGDHFI